MLQTDKKKNKKTTTGTCLGTNSIVKANIRESQDRVHASPQCNSITNVERQINYIRLNKDAGAAQPPPGIDKVRFTSYNFNF